MRRRFELVWVLIAATVVVGGCAATTSGTSRGSGIDQQPMYGSIDRQSNAQLKAGDVQFIAGVTKEFGSREKASEMYVEQGIRYYRQDNYSMAMKRFNQAWLLNSNNPDVYWGFGIIYHDEGKNCEAKQMMDRALGLNLSKLIAIADAARIYTLCAASNVSLDQGTKSQYFSKSEELYRQASSISPNNDYIYGSWASALYWQGKYVEAWEKVAKQRSLGGTPPAQFINLLRAKMSEPKS